MANELIAVRRLIADDAHALTFQTFGQYRTALLKAVDALALTSPVAPEQVVAEELSPEFTDTARAALLWVLWHHQGASSKVGQPIRFALGMGQFDHLNEHQLSEAKRWDALAASPEAAPAAPLLMQDENSGRDGRRYNEWHASRPDARLNAREAAAATPAAPSAVTDEQIDQWAQRHNIQLGTEELRVMVEDARTMENAA